MMRVQERIALSDVTSQVNNKTNRFVEKDKKTLDQKAKNTDDIERYKSLYGSILVEKDSRLDRSTNFSEAESMMDKRCDLTSEQMEFEEVEDANNQSDRSFDTVTERPTESKEFEDDFNPLLPVFTEASDRMYRYVQRKLYREYPDPHDEDTWDPVMVSEYTNEIFSHIGSLEQKLSPNPRYIEFQPELTWSYRSTLVDWIIQVHDRFQLLPETLYLTINIIDRFLSKKQVTLNRLQLVGAAALFIAAKYEEVNCPTLKDILYMLDNAYNKEEVLRAERFMINTLEFELGWPGPMSFLRRVSKADDYEYDTRTVAKYLLEVSVMEAELVAAPPSWLAAGAYYLSKIIIGLNGWSDEHIFYSGYSEEQLIPLATLLLDSCRHSTERHKSIFEKYSRTRHRKSALIVAKWISMAESRLEKA